MKSANALQYTLYVPSAKAEPGIRTRLVNVARGATVGTGYGLWQSPSGELVGEPITTITLIVQTDYAQGVETELERIAQDLRDTGEEAAMYTVTPLTVRWKGKL